MSGKLAVGVAMQGLPKIVRAPIGYRGASRGHLCDIILYKSYGQESCTKKGVVNVAQFKGVIQICQRPTLVATVTKI